MVSLNLTHTTDFAPELASVLAGGFTCWYPLLKLEFLKTARLKKPLSLVVR